MRFFRQPLLLMVVVFIVLTACSTPAPTVTPLPTLAPTSTVTPVSTDTPTPIATPLPTATLPPPAATPFVVAGPPAIEFNLGDAALIQPQFPPDSKFYTMPLRLNGVIAVPEGSGPFPVVVMLHGRHDICPEVDGQEMLQQWPCAEEQGNYQGFAYLASALAARGYLAMSINVNAAYTNGWGEDSNGARFPQIVDLYLASLAVANAGTDAGFNTPLAGKTDLSRIALIAHSQSGALATSVANNRAENTAPELIAQGFGPIGALLYLAPAVDPDTRGVPDLPLSVVLPACDQDLSDLPGQHYYETARLMPDRQSFAAALYLIGANHNFFNAILNDEPRGSQRGGCGESARLPADEQRAFLAQYAPDFMDAALGLKSRPETAGLDAFTRAPDRLYGYRVLTSLALPAAQRRIVLLPTESNRFQNAFGQPHQISGPLDVAFCATDQPCLTWPIQPGQSDELRLSWTGPQAAFLTALPYEAEDLSGFQMLHLRALVDPTAFLNASRLPQSFSVILQDTTGLSSTVEVSARTPALQMQPGAPSTDFFGWSGLAPMSSIRLPLTDFKGIDRSRISSIGLALDGQPTGSILIADLEFLSKAPAALRAATVVSGTIRAVAPLTLTGDMRVAVQLQDTSQADAPVLTMGQIDLAGAGQVLPLEFAIAYDGRAIVPTHTYSIRAQLFVSNELRYASTAAYAVITQDNPTSGLDIVVEPLAAGPQFGGVISGTVTYLERITLPEDAQIEVILIDNSASDVASQLIGQQLITANGRQVPVAFAIEYPSEQIDPAHVYTLQARITLGNQPLFDTPQPIPVLTDRNPITNVEIVVQPVQ
jgi:uncharacterized lipoprotein YbaY